jgi:hypothetical protein
LDSEAVSHPQLRYGSYYLVVILTWLIVGRGLYVAFVRLSANKPGSPLWDAISLALLFFCLNIVAIKHGDLRAQLDISGLGSLPAVQICYESNDPKDGLAYAEGQMLARTEKVVCLANVVGQTIGGVSYAKTNDHRLLLISSEKVLRIAVEPPVGLNQELTEKQQ